MFDRNAIEVGLGRKPADVVFRAGKLVNVWTEEIYLADVAVAGDRVAAIGEVSALIGDSTKIIDASGMYLVPGLIDPHVHAEVSKLSITSYAKAVLPHGTTSICTAFDQIAAVRGISGIWYMLDEARPLPLRVFNAPPSKIPYTIPPSTLGASVGPSDHRIALDWDEAAGIAETESDFVFRGDADVFASIAECETRRLPIHGHAPFVTGTRLGAYLNCGARDDHESFSMEETVDKLRNGLYCLLREAPMAHNLTDCIRAVTECGLSARHVGLCSDDTDTTTLVALGHMDHIVRVAMAQGVAPMTAIQMATVNSAEALRLEDKIGAILPGRYADILLVPDLKEFRIAATYVGGVLVAREDVMQVELVPPTRPADLLSTFSLSPVAPDDLAYRTDLPEGKARVIVMRMPPDIPLRLGEEVELQVENGIILPDPARDVLYVAVLERYRNTGSRSVAFLSGFNLREGAIASSLSPDDQNVLCLGADTLSMATAVNRIIELGGGQVVTRGSQVLEELELPIAGIMSDVEPGEMVEAERRLTEAAHSLGCTLANPFMWLIFLPITAIPEYALTDRGFVEAKTLSFVDPVLGSA
jgi:adenine deaminase